MFVKPTLDIIEEVTDILQLRPVFVEKPHWQENYHDFLQNMVFQKNPPSYAEALEALSVLHGRALKSVQNSQK